jgi:uncharacterized RDD family membrane protein YckC
MNENNESTQNELLRSSDTIEEESIIRNHAEQNREPGMNASQVGHPAADIRITEGAALPYAGFWMRFWAYLADIIIIASINRIIVHPIFKLMDLSSGQGWFSPEAIFTAIVYYLYFTLMTKFLGQTLGKMIFGLKVVGLKEEKLSWGTVVFREFIGRFISKTIIVGYIIVGLMPKKQGLHDIFADTTVILDKR